MIVNKDDIVNTYLLGTPYHNTETYVNLNLTFSF